MKKFRNIATVVLMVVFCLSAMAVTASADYDRFSETEYYFYIEDDWWNEVRYSVSLDFDAMEARINSYSGDTDEIEIPSFFEYDDEIFAVTEILGGDKYNEWQSCVTVPSSVTVIHPESLGYYLGEVEIDNSYWDEFGDYVYDFDTVEKMLPVDGFTIRCAEGSAAEEYAILNGFECETFRSISEAEIWFDESDFVYTGWSIEPQITVMLSEVALREWSDYEVFYSSNVDAGTAYVTVKGRGMYTGVLVAEFEILPVDVSMLTFSEIPLQYYSGNGIKPYINVSYQGYYLWQNEDYYVSYVNNTDPGKAKAVLEFFGNYKGTKEITFEIALLPIESFTASAASDSVKLSWTNIPCDEYRLYIYDNSKKKYVIVKKGTDSSYTHKNRKQLTTYKYAVKGIVYGENGTYTTKSMYLTVTTKPNTPTVSLATGNKSVTIKWKKNGRVDGYVIYRMTNWDYEYEKVKSIKDKNVTSWTNKGLSKNDDYYYVVRSYKKVDGKYIYSDYSEQKFSGSSQSRLNAATLKSRRTIKVYNTQGKKSSLAFTYTLSDNDIKILQKFAKKYFTDDMSREEVLKITLDWINRNVKYASGDLWYEISGMSYVEAIFTHKKGQCVQYNGAMAAMMAYLGYDVELIQGYRYSRTTGAKWQHFWVEAEIAGNTYVFETGNYGKDGTWSYFCKKYSETFGYMKYGKKL